MAAGAGRPGAAWEGPARASPDGDASITILNRKDQLGYTSN
jgi:hypothetical protein